MNKEDFSCALQTKLSGLPQEDLERSLEFYREAIDDRMESGLTEEEAVGDLGPVDEIVEQILSETPLPKLIRAKVTPSHALRAWEIILLVLGSPVWLPLILAAAATGLAIYAAIWSVMIAVYAVVLAFALSGMVLLITGIGQLLFAGMGLALIGLSVLLFFAANEIAKGIVFLSRKYVLWMKSLFVKREEAK
ncbi:MAG: DUF1700 domain-containing protein [Faecousia sp.]